MNTPKIRFKGFEDDWEQRKFKELCDMVTVGIANSATHAYSDSGVVMFRNQNIKPNFLDDTDIIHINSEFEVKYKNKRLKKNDLLVARTGYPGTACVVPEKYENSQTFTTLIARPNENIDPYFLCQYLNSDIGIKYFESTQIGGGQKNSGAGILNEMPVTLPSTIEEEKQIADHFIQLDNLITLHQRKCDETKQLKKFMLQKMFPKNGEKNPEIRFEGFTDDWEQRKLSEVADKVSEKNKNNEYSEPLTNSAEQGIISQKDYFDREVVNEDNLNGYYIVKKNDFVYNPRVSVSAPVGPINRNKLGRNGVMSPLYTVFRTHDIDEMYLEYYYKTTKWHRFMKLNGDSGARFDRFTISSTLFMEMPIPYPSIEEQKKIGEYFSNLDNLITLHQRKCEKLKELKKYMLQNMFV